MGLGVLVVCGWGQIALAGQTVELDQASALADQSPKTTSVQPTPAHDPEKGYSVQILAKRSLFFPSIAHSDMPLSPGEKFNLAVLNSTSPAAFLGSGFRAAIGQAADTPAGYGQGGEGYFKRFGASLATNASTNLFGTFLLASLAHHDPRYFVEGDGSVGQSIKYGLRRVVFTRTDAGHKAFNWDGLTAPLLAASLANAYRPEQNRTASDTFKQYGIAIAITAGVNALKEYWPTITRRVLVPIHMDW